MTDTYPELVMVYAVIPKRLCQFHYRGNCHHPSVPTSRHVLCHTDTALLSNLAQTTAHTPPTATTTVGSTKTWWGLANVSFGEPDLYRRINGGGRHCLCVKLRLSISFVIPTCCQSIRQIVNDLLPNLVINKGVVSECRQRWHDKTFCKGSIFWKCC